MSGVNDTHDVSSFSSNVRIHLCKVERRVESESPAYKFDPSADVCVQEMDQDTVTTTQDGLKDKSDENGCISCRLGCLRPRDES